MTKKHAIGFIEYVININGAAAGCQLIATHLGISWSTVYGWYRRNSVPAWRLEALERARPIVLAGERQAAE